MENGQILASHRALRLECQCTTGATQTSFKAQAQSTRHAMQEEEKG